jgi:phosphopantothenoylcysteine decarboxylase/phosphopantothenate--cysteine ligase
MESQRNWRLQTARIKLGEKKMEDASEKIEKRKLPCENLLIGITGSVGAVNMPIYIQYIKNKFAENIFIMISKAAKYFVSSYSLELISGHKTFEDLFTPQNEYKVPHIQLPKQADFFLIMPATANIISKAANGIADDLISTSIVSSSCPVVFIPSMNSVMWFNRIIQRNIKLLRESKYYVMEPSYGIEVSDSRREFGAMPQMNLILEYLEKIIKGQ